MTTRNALLAILFVAIVYGLYVALQNGSLQPIGDVLSNLSNAQGPTTIAQYARNAGFSGPDLVVAVAIAYAESSGNPNAYNPETAAGTPQGKGSYGLWQIYLKAHPEFASWNLYDPQQNANAAYSVYQAAGFSFRPWSTFTGDTFTQYLDKANAEVSV